MAYIEGQDRNQTVLFPESIDDYISDDSMARVIEEYVEQLDLLKLKFTRAACPKMGRPPYDPKDLLKLYIYGYLNRIRSSRRLEHEAARNIEVIWLLKKLKPDFKTIADFRKDNKKALRAVFREFTRLCNEWDLFGKELIAIDGSKFRACNAKKHNYNDKKLKRKLRYIDEKIDKYMQELDETDQAEASERKPDAEEIKERIKKLRERKHKYEACQKELEDTGVNEISTTDPDARLMSNNNNTVDVSYNVQTTVDSEHKLVLDFKVTQNSTDLGELDNMALRAKKILGVDELEALADKGYYIADDLIKCVKHGITPYVTKQVRSNATGDRDFYSDRFTYNKDKDVYICPAGNELTRHKARKENGRITGFNYHNYKACSNCSLKDRCTKSTKGRIILRHKDQDFLDTIDVQTKLNMDKYKQRQTIVEHPFGTIKRAWGAYHFLTKRKVSVTAEMSLTFLAYNMKRAINILGAKEIIRRLGERRATQLA